MTEKEKKLALEMRAEGVSYKEISEKLGINETTLKVAVSRHNNAQKGSSDKIRRCIQCKRVLPKKARATQRFCSNKCHNEWWNSHQDQLRGDKHVVHRCVVCGKEFASYKKAGFCSRECYYVSLKGKVMGK